MRKTKQSIQKAIDDYTEIVTREFPGLKFNAHLHPEAGVDAWLWISLDSSNQHLREAIEAFTLNLTSQLSHDDDDIYIVAIPHMKEPVHG